MAHKLILLIMNLMKFRLIGDQIIIINYYTTQSFDSGGKF